MHLISLEYGQQVEYMTKYKLIFCFPTVKIQKNIKLSY